MDTSLANLTPVQSPSLYLTSAWAPPTRGPRLAATPRRRAQRGQEVLTTPEWTDVARSLRLSPRELQIVQGVFDDFKEAAIADNLGISAHTVHTHLERLYRKLSVRGRCPMIVAIFAELLQLNCLGEVRTG